MGLDMYLYQNFYVGAEYAFRKVHGTIDITAEGERLDIDLRKVSTVVTQVAYWRKANAIHKWFVERCQEGRDECQESDVGYEQLIELRELCKKALKTRDASLLPPQAGFFFGSTEADDYYFESLQQTVDMLADLDPKGDYTYRASW